MLENIKIDKILFLDIETVPQYPNYKKVPERMKKLWDKKSDQLTKGETPPDENYNRAGIYAEFGKIVCISAGIIHGKSPNFELRIKSFYGDDEERLLTDFSSLLSKYYNTKDHLLCAHNGKEFDFPYLCRRMLINGLKLPQILNIAGKKPWEINHLDTLELWKFGDYKSFTSLNLLTTVFDIPTPKDDIDGSDVWRVYWQDKDVERISNYCEKDVRALVQLLLKYLGEPLIKPENITIS